MPLWLVSGAFFPAAGVPGWLGICMRLNPLTYGMAAFRTALFPAGSEQLAGLPPFGVSMKVTLLFAAISFFVACLLASKRGSGATT